MLCERSHNQSSLVSDDHPNSSTLFLLEEYPIKLILYHDVLGGRQDVTGLTDGGVAAKWCEVYSRSLSLACCRIWPSVQECFPSLRLLGLFHISQLTIENRVGSLISAKIHPIKSMKFEHCLKLSWFQSGTWFL